jgi:hypothetical protein
LEILSAEIIARGPQFQEWCLAKRKKEKPILDIVISYCIWQRHSNLHGGGGIQFLLFLVFRFNAQAGWVT